MSVATEVKFCCCLPVFVQLVCITQIGNVMEPENDSNILMAQV